MRSTLAAALAVAVTLAAAGPSEAVRRHAFVTSVSGTGNLTSWPDAGGQVGLAAGDQICRSRAEAAGLPNSSAYRAWLSTASTDAYCHVRGQTGKRSAGCAGGPPEPAGPWFRVSPLPVLQAPITESLDDLVAPGGVIYRSVLRNELGGSVAGEPLTAVWTGTSLDGASASPDTNCAGWVSAAADHLGLAGDATATAQLWTARSAATCNTSLRLLCVEPGTSEPTGQEWDAPGAIVFLTSLEGTGDLSSWAQAAGQTGLAAGDEICRTLAAQAHLPAPQSFVAWLSDSQQDARDRLTSNGPFRRIDGVTVAGSKAELLDGSIAGSIHQLETGAYKIGGAGGEVFTATLEDGTASALNCSDWTSATPADAGKGSGAESESASWTFAGTTSCDYSQQLYCFSNVITVFWDGFDSTGDTSRWSSTVP